MRSSTEKQWETDGNYQWSWPKVNLSRQPNPTGLLCDTKRGADRKDPQSGPRPSLVVPTILPPLEPSLFWRKGRRKKDQETVGTGVQHLVDHLIDISLSDEQRNSPSGYEYIHTRISSHPSLSEVPSVKITREGVVCGLGKCR